MEYIGFRHKCLIPSPDASFVPYEFSMTIKAVRVLRQAQDARIIICIHAKCWVP